MKQDYYQIPIKLHNIFKKGDMDKTAIWAESIVRNVHLILITQFGENRFDETYGCAVWEEDFENIYSDSIWNERMSNTIKQTLAKHEPRLSDLSIKVQIGEKETISGVKNDVFRLKRKISIEITGNYVITNEPLSFTRVLFISPLATEEE